MKIESKAPFPWYGGKSKAAPAVWEALGDVVHYVEPFAGSLAVLLGRPHEANRPYHSETVNDLDGLLCNVWRSIQAAPDETAEHCSFPVCETELVARHYALVKWRDEEREAWLAASPENYDPRMAGWWLYGVCASIAISGGWCTGDGPWYPDADGRMRKHPKPRGREAAREPGVTRELPHLTGGGKGVHHAGAREPGVTRGLPHIANNGKGVHHAGAREPGVTRGLPHISDDGKGVHRPQTREPGTEYHDVTMPELRRWFAWLSARLRHVRIINGDWRRVVTTGAAFNLPVRSGKGSCGVFLDPPYADTAARSASLYTSDSLTVAHDAREWALANGANPKFRIVFSSYEGEHGGRFEAAGWRSVEWFEAGFLTGGMGNTSRDGSTHQQVRERLWLSPHCLKPTEAQQMGLFPVEAP